MNKPVLLHRNALNAPRPARHWMGLFPLAFPALIGLLLAARRSRPFAEWLIAENHPVELVTFLTLATGGVCGLALWRKARAHGLPPWASGFYLVFAVGLLVAAMEEVAWGQWLLGFRTPELMREINVQGEMTLHNIKGMHGHTEYFRLAFGLGGLIGLALSTRARFRKIAPPLWLLTWFAAITALASIDLYNDFIKLGRTADLVVNRLSEVVEMLVGICGLLYVRFQTRIIDETARTEVAAREATVDSAPPASPLLAEEVPPARAQVGSG